MKKRGRTGIQQAFPKACPVLKSCIFLQAEKLSLNWRKLPGENELLVWASVLQMKVVLKCSRWHSVGNRPPPTPIHILAVSSPSETQHSMWHQRKAVYNTTVDSGLPQPVLIFSCVFEVSSRRIIYRCWYWFWFLLPFHFSLVISKDNLNGKGIGNIIFYFTALALQEFLKPVTS